MIIWFVCKRKFRDYVSLTCKKDRRCPILLCIGEKPNSIALPMTNFGFINKIFCCMLSLAICIVEWLDFKTLWSSQTKFTTNKLVLYWICWHLYYKLQLKMENKLGSHSLARRRSDHHGYCACWIRLHLAARLG